MQQAEQNYPRYGEIWLVDSGSVVGAEIGKRRPGLVVSNDISNRLAGTVTILPLTSRPAKREYPDEVLVPKGEAGLNRASRIKANMITASDKSRFLKLIGRLPEQYYKEVNRALRIHLNMQ
ncbi:MAG: type II toxin-antitoxin system PemK/MazF family toxin [Dehalococcoidia bacterium]